VKTKSFTQDWNEGICCIYWSLADACHWLLTCLSLASFVICIAALSLCTLIYHSCRPSKYFHNIQSTYTSFFVSLLPPYPSCILSFLIPLLTLPTSSSISPLSYLVTDFRLILLTLSVEFFTLPHVNSQTHTHARLYVFMHHIYTYM